jgi:hypothetical protein
LLLACFALGCGGNAVDLGHDARGWSDTLEPPSGPATPQTIYEGGERVLAFTIDETTLYALVAQPDTFELVSCPLDACRSQRTTLYKGPALVYQEIYSTTLMLVSDSIMWRMDDRAEGSFAGIASCLKTGCEELTLVPASSQTVATDGEHAYWIDAQRYVMRISPGATQPELVRDLNPELYALQPRAAVGKDHFFYTEKDEVYAVRKDGTGDRQLVLKEENLSDLGVSGEELYYSTRLLTGSINHCQADQCANTRGAIASAQPWTIAVHVTGDEVFWLNQRPKMTDPLIASLLSCALPGCESVRQWSVDFVTNHSDPADAPFSFAVNQRYLVWVERFQQLGSGLRRMAR